ncbi:ABC transporter substrate-binding protein [Pluralibacter gergoviae]|nr:ABC transporter substrate-binding protein [Pluralibacter gergoviae]EKT9641908.1 ABC transporter substrate-binding protein [Pluralibacter gergoviae]EKV0931429.1 ABC transporter substrate-binding protein [Pluralibacter gergoviae]EKV3546057.1 ABC transporter substrate-binding protein [Pluralibacter gergoviae]EKV9900773.1 ABC transporter substrate-binding protein [Pluralibacter gergoviae]EKV9932412.1 ABC transporter substrate-binding protein [Pluralibacter gergoviae]
MKIINTFSPALTGLLLFTAANHAHAEEKFTFLTNWYAQAEHGGFYQAQAAGLYQRAGLDVTIKMGGPQVSVMQLMAAGQADCTLGDNVQALETWQAGIHAVTVATVFQHSPTVFISHDKIATPQALKDKTFLLATEAYTSFWPWAKSELGFSASKVRPYTFSVQPFLADKNLVQQGYLTSEPFAVAKGGQPFYVYPLSDWGYPPYGNAIICMADTVKKRPRVIAAFIKASMQGWKAYLQDPAAGNALIQKANPQMGADQIAFGIAQMKKFALVTGGDAQSSGIGTIAEARLKKTWDMLVQNKLIDADKVPFARTYTLDLIKDAKVMP